MCGIAGLYSLNGTSISLEQLEAMTRVLRHRGPDGEGYVLLAPGQKHKPISVSRPLSQSIQATPPHYRLGLGHRRLAILDPSPLGQQPMSSEDERIWLTYNGEIYNYLELRRELQALGWTFRSMTDTEVLLTAYRQWGTDCLARLNGMFAFALWDSARARLWCARDRLGMKPFYYCAGPQRFAFASEIKALLIARTGERRPNFQTIHDFLVHGLQDHGAETFFEGIQQLPPGHALLVQDDTVTISRWWSLEPGVQGGTTVTEAAESFKALFREAVRLHLRSDVPVGSCLSGGLDSSTLVCTMSEFLDRPVKTFSSYFDEPGCDERRYSQAVLVQTGGQGHVVQPDAHRLFTEMPQVLWFQEEPFGGTSYLAQWAVMRVAAEQGVKVLLDGQGGDELLCGYPGYWGSYLADLIRARRPADALREWRALRRMGGGLHPTIGGNVARALMPSDWVTRSLSWMKGHAGWIDPDFARRHYRLATYPNRFPSALENHQAAYLQTHSLPALLHHEDRNAMAFSIEARLPFLDIRLVDYLLRLPPELKLHQGISKVVLRAATAGVIPEEVRRRTDKVGFATPQDRWLRMTLRPQVEEILHDPAFERRPYWRGRHIRKAYRDYCEGGQAIGGSVWRWVCLELWHQRFFPGT